MGAKRPLKERFWEKVDKRGDDECWLWRAAVMSADWPYGVIGSGEGRWNYHAHRLSYEWAKGPIPEGLMLDHLCRNPRCVNPAHLEAVTPRENTLRGVGPSAQAALKGACPKGHPYAGENLAVNERGHRNCRQCKRDTAKALYWAKKAVTS